MFKNLTLEESSIGNRPHFRYPGRNYETTTDTNIRLDIDTFRLVDCFTYRFDEYDTEALIRLISSANGLRNITILAKTTEADLDMRNFQSLLQIMQSIVTHEHCCTINNVNILMHFSFDRFGPLYNWSKKFNRNIQSFFDVLQHNILLKYQFKELNIGAYFEHCDKYDARCIFLEWKY